jgi:hypothetical protein
LETVPVWRSSFWRVCKIAKSDYSGHEDPKGKQMCGSSFSLTSSLNGGGWSTPRTDRLTLRKDPVPILQEAGWAPGPVWTGTEKSTLTGIRFPDRPARSESLYRLSYPGLQERLLVQII